MIDPDTNPSLSETTTSSQDGEGSSLLGTQLGAYQLVGMLGRGGMGTIFLGKHASIGRTAAIKVLRKELLQDRENQERFLRECKTLASLKHPNIIEIEDIGRSQDGLLYYVMEYLEGESLLTRIGHGLLSFDEIMQVIEPLCAALSYAHQQGVVHRDIKPDNIFLLPRPNQAPLVKILDFGLARVVRDANQKLTQTGSVLGTPHYMSPEQINGVAVDARSDLYSVGVLLYVLCAGRFPFGGDNISAVLHGHMFEQPPLLTADPARQIPAPVGDIVEKALQKNPKERYATMDALADALRAARRSRKRLPPPGTVAAKGNGPRAIALGAALLAVIAGGFWYATRTQPSNAAPANQTQNATENDTVSLRNKSLSVLRTMLREASPALRAKAAHALAALGDRESRSQIEALAELPEAQRAAIEALAQLGDSAALPFLGSLSNGNAALWAAAARGSLGEKNTEFILLAALKNPAQQREAALLLAELGNASALPVLELQLATESSPELLAAALRLDSKAAQEKTQQLFAGSPRDKLLAAKLWANLGDETGKEECLSLLGSQDPSLRLEAAEILLSLGDYSGVSVFQQQLADTHEPLQSRAIHALGLVGDQKTLPSLTPFLQKTPSLQIASATAILEIIGLGAELLALGDEDLLEKALQSEDALTRNQALLTLSLSPENTGRYVSVLLRSSDAALRQRGVALSDKLRPEEQRTALARALEDPDPLVSLAAANKLREQNTPEAKAALENIEKAQPDSIVALSGKAARGDDKAQKALEVLLQNSNESGQLSAIAAAKEAKLTDLLASLLASPRDKIRGAALRALALLGDKRALPQLATLSATGGAAGTEASILRYLLGDKLGELSWSGEGTSNEKKSVLALLGNLPQQVQEKLLRGALRDTQEEVRLQALSTLETLSKLDPENARRLYLLASQDISRLIRQLAQNKLAELTQEPKSQPSSQSTSLATSVPTQPTAPTGNLDTEEKTREYKILLSAATASLASGNYANAIRQLKQAQKLNPSAPLGFEFGEAYRRWGYQANDSKEQKQRWESAIRSYKQVKKGPQATKAKRYIEELEKELGR